MPRPTAIVIYSAVFGIALLFGLLIATLLLPQSLPAASFAPPAATTEPLASVSGLRAAPAPRREPPIATSAPLSASPTAAPASTPAPSPTATEIVFPTITPTTAAAPAPAAAAAASSRLTFGARVTERPTDAAVSCGASFESHIWGVVKNGAGRGIYRAVVMVRSSDGKNRFSAQTNDQGGFEIPGLGCTTWIVRLVSVPRAPAGVQAPELRISLNGARYSGAGVEFRQR